VFDHVGIAVSDLAASERFYRTVLSVLGVEPSHADAELVEWEDWAIGPCRRRPGRRNVNTGSLMNASASAAATFGTSPAAAIRTSIGLNAMTISSPSKTDRQALTERRDLAPGCRETSLNPCSGSPKSKPCTYLDSYVTVTKGLP
jgi:hypothetical protein